MIAGLNALVKSKTDITNEIGSGDDCRFYPKHQTQGVNTFPMATYQVFNNQGTGTFDSPSKYEFASVDIHCHAKTALEAENLWNLIRKEIEYESGTYGGIVIHDVEYQDSGQEGFDPELETHTKLLELRISYKRTP